MNQKRSQIRTFVGGANFNVVNVTESLRNNPEFPSISRALE